MLTAETTAREYHRLNGWKTWAGAQALVDDIERWLASKGLAQSSLNRLDIAEHVLRLRSEPEPIPSPEATAWQANLTEGVGDDAALQLADELAFAERIRTTPMADWGRARQQFGLAKSTLDHLAGV